MKALVRRGAGHILQCLGLKDPLKLAANEVVTRVGLSTYAPRLHPALQWWCILAKSRHILRALPPADGPVVAFLSSIGAFKFTGYDLVIAQALRLRGVRPLLLLCGGSLPACEGVVVERYPGGTPDAFLTSGPHFRCADCQAGGQRLYDASCLDVVHFSDLVAPDARRSVREALQSIALGEEFNAAYKGVGIGTHVKASVERFLLRGDLEDDPVTRAVARRYLEAALLQVEMTDELLSRYGVDVLVAHHGIYVVQGVPVEVAQRRGARAVVWGGGLRGATWRAGPGESMIRFLAKQLPAPSMPRPLTGEDNRELDDLLASRQAGDHRLVAFHSGTVMESDAVRNVLGLDSGRPIVSLFTNVAWDAAIMYPSRAFPRMVDWVNETIRYFVTRPEFQLVVRIHPAEKRLAHVCRQPMTSEIQACFPDLPPNVSVVAPEKPVNSYALGQISVAALIYGTQLGLELAAMGVPVVMAAEGAYWQKGFTFDARDRESYFQLLDKIQSLEPDDPTRTERARHWAHYFYFRRMLDFPFIKYSRGGDHSFNFESLEALLPGHHAGLDIICKGILEGTDFVVE
jgi:hypothetical protein